ncbi:hypothetical protein ACFRR6_02790 [Streptomyces sp. NPDC056891]|uniref:hypothetical protein n=1 Tax=Streptomyces sp. NPDC056891 TaxID=3345961 RepID=UPI0036B4C6E2
MTEVLLAVLALDPAEPMQIAEVLATDVLVLMKYHDEALRYRADFDPPDFRALRCSRTSKDLLD